MMVMMKRQQEQQQIQTTFTMRQDQTIFTWPLQQLPYHHHHYQVPNLVMNSLGDQEDIKPAITKNMAKIEDQELERTNALDHLSFSQLLLDHNNNLGEGLSTNSILSTNTSNNHQWFGNVIDEDIDLFSGATSTSADQDTIRWEDISSLVCPDSK